MSSKSMHMQNLVKIYQSFPKILGGNENVTTGRTDGRTDNLKIVYPPYSVCGGGGGGGGEGGGIIMMIHFSIENKYSCRT